MDVLATLTLSLLAVLVSFIRMAAALIVSVLFSIVVGTAAGVNKSFEKVAVPVLDILQSIPILGFFPVAIQVFYAASPVFGAELAAIFLIFTSQVWNITFAVYESTRFIQPELLDVANSMRMSAFERFRHIYLPACLPRVVRNFQPSWANGMFFIVGAEILAFGDVELKLFGVGTLVSEFAVAGDLLGIVTVLLVLFAATIMVNVLVFIPLGTMFETAGPPPPGLLRRFAFIKKFAKPFQTSLATPVISFFEYQRSVSGLVNRVSVLGSLVRNLIFLILIGFLATLAITRGNEFFGSLYQTLGRVGVDNLLSSAVFSFVRVMGAVGFSVAWSIPAAVAIARRPQLSTAVTTVFQVVASIPVTIVYPLFAETLRDQPELRAFVMILAATQWYVFFQVLAGLKNIPRSELEVADMLQLKTWTRIRMVYLPRALPALITGCITAAGGAWNGLVVAERLVLGDLVAETDLPGLGKLLSQLTYAGDMLGSVSVLIVMSSIVVLMNRFFWKKLYDLVASKLKIE
uniref:Sulfonate/nitrate/taurine transport system permease protein n=1 Tax=uncultured crenarchaeote TaxID=29281 RepID=H5SB79_9CREN|nr:sulfonate/nitrate/taurine transport system permease protein [uncultured crenarchaeote]